MRVEINREVFQVEGVVMTGQELRELADIPADEVLCGKGTPHYDEVGTEDGSGYLVKLDKAFKPYEGQEFFTVLREAGS